MSTRTIFPSSMIKVSTARSALATPTNCRSISVSTTASYSLVVSDGDRSLWNRSLISLDSTIRLSLRTVLVRSINCFNASVLLTNQLCRGLFRIP